MVASAFAARRTCRAVGPTEEMAGTAAMSCSSVIRRGATSERSAGASTFGPGGGATAKARTATARAAAIARSRCRREPRGWRRWAALDLVGAGQRAVVAQGGRGGHGNKRFANSTRQSPRFAERGTRGEAGWIELRLKLLADVGLVGLPNAGKSSLLGRLTRAAPKVAEYPFTTISPALGVLDGAERQVVLADIPGLIEGAAQGAGLGHEFLAHVERCSMLIHLVDLAPLEGDPESNYAAVRAELASYGAGLDALPELIVLSKRDLLPADDGGIALRDWRQRLGARVLGVLPVSSATGAGLEELRARSSPSPSCPRSPVRRRAGRGAVRGRAPRLPPGW